MNGRELAASFLAIRRDSASLNNCFFTESKKPGRSLGMLYDERLKKGDKPMSLHAAALQPSRSFSCFFFRFAAIVACHLWRKVSLFSIVVITERSAGKFSLRPFWMNIQYLRLYVENLGNSDVCLDLIFTDCPSQILYPVSFWCNNRIVQTLFTTFVRQTIFFTAKISDLSAINWKKTRSREIFTMILCMNHRRV